MDRTASQNLAEAWLARARRARADYNAAQAAPALFKPEWIERAESDFAHAMGQAAFWQNQAAS